MPALSVPHVSDAALPPYVSTAEERRRWELCVYIASTISATCEPSGVPDAAFVFVTSRHLYRLPLATDDVAVEEALDAAEGAGRARADELLEQVLADTDDDPWALIGRHMDVLDELFGDPDGFDLGEAWDREAAMAGLVEAPYSELLHPRDRLGKWARKFGQLRRFVKENRGALRSETGGELAIEVRKAGRDGDPDLVRRMMARYDIGHDQAVEMVALQSVRAVDRASKAKKAAHVAKTVALGETLTAIANFYVDDHSGKMNVATGHGHKDANAAVDRLDQVHHLADLAKELAAWASEHREEAHTLLSLAHHILAAVGLHAADDGDAAGRELEIVESIAA